MNKMPDYIGRWFVDDDREHINALGGKDKYELVSLVFNHGHFTFFIDERKSINNLTERVKGRIYDALGEASFEGKLARGVGKDIITFVKKYNKDVVNEGLTVDKIPYLGEGKIETGFFGSYFMKIALGNRFEWKGKFLMKRYAGGNVN